MRTVHSLPYGGGGSMSRGSLSGRPPRPRPPRPKEHGVADVDPPLGTWDQVAEQEGTSYRDPLPPVNTMIDRQV